MVTLDIWKTFYKGNEKHVGPGNGFLEHLEVKVLKVSLGVGFKDVPVCPKKL